MKLVDGSSLYEVLAVSREASQSEIKKAYMKMALKLHPDKNPGDEAAKDRFQTLQRIYGILSNPERRKVYDQTGSMEDSEELTGERFNDLYEYYRSMYKKVMEDDIREFEREYRGSEEELHDLLELYKKHKGDMAVVFEWQMCSKPNKDSHRFADAIELAIANGTARSFKRFARWAEKVRQKPAPKNPLKPSSRSAGGGPGQDLVAMMKGKNEVRANNLLADLEAKYGAGKGSKKVKGTGKSTKRGGEPPSEEEFAAAQSRLEKKKAKT
mmetsp:Transcript_22140/g.61460  ORF Transcript_22140/g.61460 Transcript_22140/m.61460 type:complete len:269 (-) Transcript_22140:1333-2139(-)